MESIGTNAEATEVLLVEDNPGNVRLSREAVRDAKVHINLKVSGKNWKAANIFGTLA